MSREQFRIAPDMLVALFFRQVEAVQIFSNLPKLGGQAVIADFDTINVLHAKRFDGFETVQPGVGSIVSRDDKSY